MTSPEVQYRFGRFILRPFERRLLRAGTPVPLGGRAFDLLVALVERHDRVVDTHELIDLVWGPADIEPANLQVQICILRRALGRKVIATVARKGYRFAHQVMRMLVPAHPAVAPWPSGLRPDHPLCTSGLTTLVGGVQGQRLAAARIMAMEFGAAFKGCVLWFKLSDTLDVHALVGLLRTLGDADALLVLEECDRFKDRATLAIDVATARLPHLRILALADHPLKVHNERAHRCRTVAHISRGAETRPHLLRWARTMRPDAGSHRLAQR